MLLVRTDATKALGAGHVMRCTAIAQEAKARGVDVLFCVSDEESAQVVRSQGFPCELIGGDPSLFLRVDAMNLARITREQGAEAVLIDSYAVTNSFFAQLHDTLSSDGVKIAYVDDAFTFKEGFSEIPAPIDADVVINYGFGFTREDYDSIYRDTGVSLCIGPEFAPVRRCFAEAHAPQRDQVENILITCGMANPRGTQEKLVEQCRKACPEARITVVVGGNSSFVEPDDDHVEVHRGVESLVPLIEQADVALSASGLTLYELAAAGLPTIAIPTASNQLGHVQGFYRLELGPQAPVHPIDYAQLSDCMHDLCASADMRRAYAERLKATVDGNGAARILDTLL